MLRQCIDPMWKFFFPSAGYCFVSAKTPPSGARL